MGRSKKKRQNPHWSPAGSFTIDPNAPKPVLEAFAYGPGKMQEADSNQLKWIEEQQGKFPVLWVNVDGLGDAQVVTELARIFDLHTLAVEDVVQANQRPKVDIYEGLFSSACACSIATRGGWKQNN